MQEAAAFRRGRTYKQEVVASTGVVASNHPLASAAGIEMLARGGNAVDAAVATLFALTVVEPMMVTPFGAGFFVIRDGVSGHVTTIDNYCSVPAAATADMYRPVRDSLDYETEGRENDIGYRAVATPGNLRGWAYVVERYGSLPLAELIEPAIAHAERGFAASAYLSQIIAHQREAIARFPATAAVFLPNGAVPRPGDRIRRHDYAQTLRQIASEGAETMYTGELARRILTDIAANGGLISAEDLASYRVVERSPVRGSYRGHDVVSMGPPSSGGTHVIQLLKLLEAFPIGQGEFQFGTPAYAHLLAEALDIAFADRRCYMGDPERVRVPVERLTSEDYADLRRGEIMQGKARQHAAGELTQTASFLGGEGANTTHCTVIDAQGTIVSTTQTAQSAFGSKATTPGVGMILNNCMLLMDPTPGRVNSIEPGKRILSSMSPTIVLRDGRPSFALGTPGGKRIFAAVTQAILNVIDHGMTLQEAMEAPRLWTQGADVELETCFANLTELESALRSYGHQVVAVEKVAGGMNGVQVDEAGRLHGAACWRADGSPIGLGGGPARPSRASGIPG